MYYCPKCKKKFRSYQRRCPQCGGPCRSCGHKQNRQLVIAIFVLSVILLCLMLVKCSLDKQSPLPSTGPSSTQPSEQGTTPPTQPTQPTDTTSQPTVPPTEPPTTPPTVPPTVPPTSPPIGGIGMYTREELEALDGKAMGYGPGDFLGRPEYAVGDQKRYEKYGSNFIAPDNGNIYLTFDCGYEHKVTGANGEKIPLTGMILDTLKQKNVKAVFFVTMAYVKDQPELVQRMIDEGHAVGNHTNNHPVMPNLSIDEMIYEVMSLHDYVKEHFGYTMHLFRPPEGQFSIRSLAVVQNLGYKTVHWSFAYADYNPDNQPEVSSALNLVLKKAHSGAIYLLHAVSETNATLLGDAIDGFRDKGYKLELFH